MDRIAFVETISKEGLTRMKKRFYLLFLAVFILSWGATYKPVLVPGTYTVKPEGSWALVDFPKDSYHSEGIQIFLGEKPDKLKIELVDGRFAGYQYGRIALGNAGTVYNFIIGSQNSYFFDSLFIDQDRNGIITPKEEVKMEEKQNVALGYTRQILEAQTKLDVTYRLSSGEELKRTLDISITFFYQKTPDNLIVFYTVKNNTLFVGSGMTGKNPVYFALVDADGNGNYNDYGVDMIFYDLNGDNRFDYTKETRVLAELQELIGMDKKKGIYRFVLGVWPTKLGVIDGQEKFNMKDYEPGS